MVKKLLTLLAILSLLSIPIYFAQITPSSTGKVFAEEEEEDDDREEEDDEDYIQETQTIVEAPILIPVGLYAIDTDGDGLVDALDPDIKVPQQKYFTDTDKDGIADIFDTYADENDFSFIDDSDSNNNGIWDSLE